MNAKFLSRMDPPTRARCFSGSGLSIRHRNSEYEYLAAWKWANSRAPRRVFFREENPGYHRLMSGMVLEGADRELIEGCRRGERDAFRALFETYQDKIYSIALRFSGDEALAMDIAQDTFLKLFSSMAEFRGDSTFGTWVYRLVVNSCLDHKRRSWRMIPMAAEVMAMLRAPGDALHGLLHAEMRGDRKSGRNG